MKIAQDSLQKVYHFLQTRGSQILSLLLILSLIFIIFSCGHKALPEIPSSEPALDTYLYQLKPTTPTPSPAPTTLPTPLKKLKKAK